jgi:hypothetical protein
MTTRGRPRLWPAPDRVRSGVHGALALLWRLLPVALGLAAMLLVGVLGGQAGGVPLLVAVLVVGGLVAGELWWNARTRRRDAARGGRSPPGDG